ncbi:Por secretion system C-terminal sorting domain-containing protein [Mesonia phycicola]|uniref:Por secretion system C-terminal sorting domain-containing protein n=2 Tax=Mesonia phycicola TaxID=579105 RepID=A0A1M6E1A9_9FLAO|nr:Por secretion system C-terminal sorting domain-containing protein [Mesonia phycicola]
MKKLINLFVLFIGGVALSQTTYIPDQNFENYLIDSSIDSDGTVNGQVSTSDISSITGIYLTNYTLSVTDLTGIEDFTSLEILDANSAGLQMNILDLSNNINIEEVYLNGGGDDLGVMAIEEIILNNNPNLRIFESSEHWGLQILDLKQLNGIDVDNLAINVSDSPVFNREICIKVNDANEATNSQGVYTSWTVNDSGVTSNFSENCTLSYTTAIKSKFYLYPNPTSRGFQIANNAINDLTTLDEIIVYNVKGKIVKKFLANDYYDITELANGIYFVKMNNQEETSVQKIIKQ